MNMSNHKIYIDGHVHLHDPGDITTCLNSALRSFQQQQVSHGGSFQGVLMFADIYPTTHFQQLQAWVKSAKHFASSGETSWHLKETGESGSLQAIDQDGNELILIQGQQFVSKENIELLCFGCKQIQNRQPIESMLSQGIEENGLLILPWGVGKWLGSRGEKINHLVEQFSSSQILLGDNGGRPSLWQLVPQFRKAQQKGIKILRGTDPLSLTGEYQRIGSFGCQIKGNLERNKPFASLLGYLKSSEIELLPFGSLLSPYTFLKNQISIRF